MARKPNYNFEKRAKEEARKAKKDAKAADRAQRKRDSSLDPAAAGEGDEPADDDAEADPAEAGEQSA
jgi:hypothetical protein